jgi:predicted lipoprotein with Yx(FWY)xxD motif
MRTPKKFLIPMLGVAALLAGCGSSSKSSSSVTAAASAGEQPGEAVKSASNSKLGTTILVDAHGMTLYSLSAEQGGKFICTNSTCLQVWHPLAAQAGATPKGSVGSLGTIKRPDGSEQVTYKGMPLYTFALDQAPGSVRGQGFKDVGTWSAVRSTGGAPTQPASPTPTTPTTPMPSEGGGYHY